ncbi:EAL domain-containing protein [Oryzibacter oryziterrae]|uniref:EAL domain-containing protein n=1 Tax=Oryzibacter oryziterrae TaxID=2766474 RepID=UPI001F3FE90C|nr:EAL domain-containing protein [Oryzibacter oryziterrae]
MHNPFAETKETETIPSQAAFDPAHLSQPVSLDDIKGLASVLWQQTDGHRVFRALIDQVPDMLYVKDRSSRFLLCNRAAALRHGYTCPEAMIGLSDFDIHPPEMAREFFAREQELMALGTSLIELEESIVDGAGNVLWMSTNKVPFVTADGTVVGLVGMGRDITERRKAEQLRLHNTRALELIAGNAPLSHVLTELVLLLEAQWPGRNASINLLDAQGLRLKRGAAPNLPEAMTLAADGLLIGPNAGACGTAAYRRQPVIVSDIAEDPLWRDFRAVALPLGYCSCWSVPVISSDGRVIGTFAVYGRSTGTPNTEELDLLQGAARIASIAIERKAVQDELRFLASHDALTGLPNRSQLARLFAVTERASGLHGGRFCVSFVNIDNLGLINESLGRDAGDQAVREVAHILKARAGSRSSVIRLVSDEFAVLMTPFDPAAVERLNLDLLLPLEGPVGTVNATISVGYAVYPDDGISLETLLVKAETALVHAKQRGKNSVLRFQAAMGSGIQDRLQLLQDMRQALNEDQFVLFYQPQVDAPSGRIFGVEALVRWRHPKHGLLSPDKFIPLAEESGLIVELGDWVLREACRQAKAWQRDGLPPLSISVNVSARQFQEGDICQAVGDALRDSGLDAGWLELELTESMLMRDEEMTVKTLGVLRGFGISLAIDDFGTGYSSLSVLKRFPVQRLKIDKSFIRNLSEDDADQAIAAVVIAIGHKLHMQVLAEGVETDKQLSVLREMGCDAYQGYLFSRPLPAENIEPLLNRA